MALLDKISDLRDEYLLLLDTSHDYFFHSKIVWRLIQQLEDQKKTISITKTNPATKNPVNEHDLSGLAQGYTTGYLASTTFQDFVSLFEQFVFDFFRIWLTEHPKSLANRTVDLKIIFDSANKNEIVNAVIEKEIYGLGYQKIEDWFAKLKQITKLDGPTKEQIALLTEIKSSRDIFVHNKGIANSTYVRKVSQELARASEGSPLELSEEYHRESWELIKKVVSNLANEGISKLSKDGGKA